MTNKQIASFIWEKVGVRLGYYFTTTTLLYFLVMGPTTTGITNSYSIGWYILGDHTYQAANNLFYSGVTLLAFMLGLGVACSVMYLLDTDG